MRNFKNQSIEYLLCLAAILVILIPAFISEHDRQVKQPVRSVAYEYVQEIKQASFDSVKSIPEGKLNNDVLLSVNVRDIDTNQKEVNIRAFNGPESGRDNYEIQTTVIKIR